MFGICGCNRSLYVVSPDSEAQTEEFLSQYALLAFQDKEWLQILIDRLSAVSEYSAQPDLFMKQARLLVLSAEFCADPLRCLAGDLWRSVVSLGSPEGRMGGGQEAYDWLLAFVLEKYGIQEGLIGLGEYMLQLAPEYFSPEKCEHLQSVLLSVYFQGQQHAMFSDMLDRQHMVPMVNFVLLYAKIVKYIQQFPVSSTQRRWLAEEVYVDAALKRGDGVLFCILSEHFSRAPLEAFSLDLFQRALRAWNWETKRSHTGDDVWGEGRLCLVRRAWQESRESSSVKVERVARAFYHALQEEYSLVYEEGDSESVEDTKERVFRAVRWFFNHLESPSSFLAWHTFIAHLRAERERIF